MDSWLKYKTRGNSTPKDKPKVFFCCHPLDFLPYFDEITDKILGLQDCSVWYMDPAGELPDARSLYDDLDLMQLVVFPVTTRFLLEEGFARDVILPHVLDNYISVLPLLQETGLNEVFNRKFGNIHFLDPKQSDAAGLSYDEKLRSFLDAVLIGSELQSKIKEAFHAYIFLSYRKSDRKYAQELMRLIHKNAFCRDIAIWYDEFLIPGENFDRSIKSAIDKCKLFAMVITPNSVEPQNYVMTTEYPYAKACDKIIIPTEFVPTDRNALNKFYKGIGPCLPSSEERAFSDVLASCLEKAKVVHKDDSPEHVFLIGLAYLSGIDVEINKGYALQLITSAAEAGLPEASKKLADMYRLGDGVARDYETAASWHERAASQLEEQMHKTGDPETAMLYLETMHYLAETWNNLWNHEKALDVCKKMIKSANVWKRLTQKSEFSRYYMKGCLTASSVCSRMGDFQEAIAYSRKGYDENKRAMNQLGAGAYGDTVVVYENYGFLYQMWERYSEAIDFYKRALEIRKGFFADLDFLEKENQYGLWLDCEKIGELHILEGKYDSALPYLQEALGYAELMLERKQSDAQRYMSISCNNLTRLNMAQEKFAEAVPFAERSITASEAYMEQTDSLESKRDLSISYTLMAELMHAQGEQVKSLACFEKSLKLSKLVLERNDTEQAYQDLAGLYMKMFMAYPVEIGWLIEAYEIWDLLSKRCPEVEKYINYRNILKSALKI